MCDIMETDNFFENLPKEVIHHIADIWDKGDGHRELIETGEMWSGWQELEDLRDMSLQQQIDNAEPEWSFIPSLWILYNFWKMKNKRSDLWHKESGYLLAEIMWLLISNKELKQGVHFYHKKEKGNNKTTFTTAKYKLVYSEKGNCWMKKEQHPNKLGNIIETIDNDTIRLSNKWKERLMKGY